jgi:Ca2+-binding EF-hand superfamily protein
MNYYINKYLNNDLNCNADKFKNNNKYKGYNKEKNIHEIVNNDNEKIKIKKSPLEEKIKGETSNKNDSIDRLDRGDINLFLEYINLIIIYENKMEEIKENLSLREDLSFKEIFLLFDKEQKNYISLDNFQLICKKVFNLFPTIDQVKLVFKRYKRILAFNKDDNIILNLEDFYQMLFPEKVEYINIVERKNTIDKTNIRLTKKSKNILTQLIKLLIQKETSYYKIKNKLNKASLENIWKEIAKFSNHEGKIYKKEMEKFLEEYSYFLNENQIDIIFSMFDKEKKQVISVNGFLEEMSY